MSQAAKSKIISASLDGNWKKVISLSVIFISENPKDIEALNRLAFAYSAGGKLKEAKSTFEKVLKIDKLNAIANKNMRRLNSAGIKKQTARAYRISNSMFLEEVGKTKVISLINTAPPKKLRALQVGQPLFLHIKRLKIFVLDETGEFIGMLPDNISKRLIKFLKGGNEYVSYARSIDSRGVLIFAKEIKRAIRFKNQPSFVVAEGKTLSIAKRKSYGSGVDSLSESTSDE